MKFLQNRKYRLMATVSKYFFVMVIILAVAMPFVVKGSVTGCGTDPNCLKIETKIDNPTKIDSFPEFVAMILNIIFVIGVPIVALAIIYTGFLFVEAQGNPEKLKKAKKALTHILIGAALLLGSWVIANAIGTTVENIKSEQPA